MPKSLTSHKHHSQSPYPPVKQHVINVDANSKLDSQPRLTTKKELKDRPSSTLIKGEIKSDLEPWMIRSFHSVRDLKDEPKSDTRSAMSPSRFGSVSIVNPESSSVSSPPEFRCPQPPPTNIQLVPDLLVTLFEALDTYEDIPCNLYQNDVVGRSKDPVGPVACNCMDHYRSGITDPIDLCGPSSNCLNRTAQRECLPSMCPAGVNCQNQRFQKGDYAKVEIVMTMQKGYGLRAVKDMAMNTFICEYVGEVMDVPELTARSLMGVSNHLYCMDLGEKEVIDATKKGGIGRFLNHSCAPNCQTETWTVNRHLRIGIFAERDIYAGEELTLDYSRDLLRACVLALEPQVCSCNEPTCVRLLDGDGEALEKQDLATILPAHDAQVADNNGADINEDSNIRSESTKPGMSDNLQNFNITPLLYRAAPKPVSMKNVSVAANALHQTQDPADLLKVLLCIQMTTDQEVLRDLVQLRAFDHMKDILKIHVTDRSIITVALDCMIHWPVLQRNKVVKSDLISTVASLAETSGVVKAMARRLIKFWETLPLGYRIPKRKEDGSTASAPICILEDEVLGLPEAPPPPSLPQTYSFRLQTERSISDKMAYKMVRIAVMSCVLQYAGLTGRVQFMRYVEDASGLDSFFLLFVHCELFLFLQITETILESLSSNSQNVLLHNNQFSEESVSPIVIFAQMRMAQLVPCPHAAGAITSPATITVSPTSDSPPQETHRIRMIHRYYDDSRQALRFDVIDRDLKPGCCLFVGRLVGPDSGSHQVNFESKVVSRTHAVVEVGTVVPSFFIRDCCSSYGTFLNGVKLLPDAKRHDLRSGDIVWLGGASGAIALPSQFLFPDSDTLESLERCSTPTPYRAVEILIELEGRKT